MFGPPIFSMKNEFDNKVILVVGGTGGLGTFVSELFLEYSPQSVIITYRSDSEKDRLLTLIGENSKRNVLGLNTTIDFVKVDVTLEKEVQALFLRINEKFGHLDIMANIVGGYAGGKPIEDITMDDWEKMSNINLKSAFLLTKYAIKPMKQRGFGKILHVSSASGEKASGNDAAYASSKAGLIRMVDSVKEEVKNKGVNINCILPTIIDTQSNREAMPDSDYSTWINPKDLAKVIIFLCSDESKSINGVALKTHGST